MAGPSSRRTARATPGSTRCSSSASSPSFYIVSQLPPVLLLRRHPPDVLPGLAPRVHHQPDRHPDRRRHPAPAAGRRDGPRLQRASVRSSSSSSSSWRRARSPTRSPSSSRGVPDIQATLPAILAAVAGTGSNSLGLGQVDLVAQAQRVLGNLDQLAGALVGPLQQIAVASLSVLGTMLIVFFLSIYMVIDRDRILAFLFRLVPPGYRRRRASSRRRCRARSAGSCAARRSWASSTSSSPS